MFHQPLKRSDIVGTQQDGWLRDGSQLPLGPTQKRARKTDASRMKTIDSLVAQARNESPGDHSGDKV